MPRSVRLDYIKRIEEMRKSRVIVYITGDRRGLETRMSMDIFPFFLDHLSRIGKQDRLDLYIYSTGGLTMAGFSLVNILREFCNSLSVIIPFKAYSSATLTALGANEIIMTNIGQLSPIDPSVVSPLGPQIPVQGPVDSVRIVPVNVEDVAGYINLARKELGIKDEELLTRLLDRLAQSVHPLTLGSVNRMREQIGFLARTVLSRHMSDSKKVEDIVETLIRGRFSHDYMIGRREAKEIMQLNVIDVSRELDDIIMSLYHEYDSLLELSVPYNREAVLGDRDLATGIFNRAIIESDDLTHMFRTTRQIRRVTFSPPQVPTPAEGYTERELDERWVQDNNI
jgi:hypothetical protein